MSLFLAPFLLGAALATPAIEAIGDDIKYLPSPAPRRSPLTPVGPLFVCLF